MKYKEAIELGKIWMKNSINRSHDYEHAKNVERHSLKIYTELNQKGEGVGFNSEIVSIIAWWHDAYKSRQADPNLWSFFFEGRECAKIVRRELEGYLSPPELKYVINAILNHNNFLVYFLLPKSYPPEVQILIEADNIEVFNRKRLVRGFRESKDALFNLIVKMYLYNIRFWLSLLPKSEYMDNFLSNFKFRNIQ